MALVSRLTSILMGRLLGTGGSFGTGWGCGLSECLASRPCLLNYRIHETSLSWGTTGLMDVQGCLISRAVSLQSGGRCSLDFRFCLRCNKCPPKVGYIEGLLGGPLAKTVLPMQGALIPGQGTRNHMPQLRHLYIYKELGTQS